MRKVLSFVLVLAMILGSVSMVFANPTYFDDAANDPVATALKWVGVLKGVGGNKADLEGTITRAEVCAVLMRILGYENLCTTETMKNSVSTFTDVPSGKWYTGYINVAASLGYVSGIGGGKFNPNGLVSYDEAIAFVMKAMGYVQKYLPGAWPVNFEAKCAALPGVKDAVASGEFELKVGKDACTREFFFYLVAAVIDDSRVYYDVDMVNSIVQELRMIDGTTKYAGQRTFYELLTGSVYVGADFFEGLATFTQAVIDQQKELTGDDYSEFLGQTLNVMYLNDGSVSDGAILCILKDNDTETKSGLYEYSADSGKSTFAGIAISDTVVGPAVGTSTYNGSPAAVSFAWFNWLGTTGEAVSNYYSIKATYELNAKGEIATINSINAWECWDVFMIGTEAALAAEPGTFAALVSDGGYKLRTTNSGAEYYGLIVEGAVNKLEDIKANDILYFYVTDDDYTITKIVVVRNLIEGPVTKIDILNEPYKYEMGGKEYLYAEQLISWIYPVTQAGSVIPTTAGVEAGKEYGFALDIDGNIFASMIKPYNEKAPEAPKYITPYALFVTASAVFGTFADPNDVVDGMYVVKDMTNVSITYIPYGTTTAVKQQFLNEADMAAAGLYDAVEGAWITSGVATYAGAIVEFATNAKGVFSGMTVAAIADPDYDNLTTNTALGYEDFEVVQNGTVVAIGIPDKNLLFADEVEIISYTTTTGVAKKVAADKLNGFVVSGYYQLDEDGKVNRMIVLQGVDTNVPEAPVVTNISLGAIITWTVEPDGKHATVLLPTGEKVAYLLTGAAYNTTLSSFGLYTGQAIGGKSCTFEAVDVDVVSAVAITTKTGVDYASNIIYATDEAYLVASNEAIKAGAKYISMNENAVAFVNDGALYAVVTDIKAAIQAFAGADAKMFALDLDQDGYYDFLIVNYK